jgi:hypothetical protein
MIWVLPLLRARGGAESDNRARRPAGLLRIPEEFKSGLLDFKQQQLFADGTFSPWPLSLVDRADSLLLNVGE